jgi:hypothetical protein
MAKLIENSTPAERARGCVFAETFENTQAVAENGGVITGDTIINKGATFDGTGDYITYPAKLNSDKISFVIRFTPDFVPGDGLQHYFYDSSFGNRYLLFKDSASGGTLVIAFNEAYIFVNVATYEPYWKTGEENVFVVSGTTGNNNIWLNGQQIVTNNITAWTPANPTELFVGARYSGSNSFDSKISEVKVFNRLLTEQEAIDYYNNSTYDYINTPVLDLPMGMEQHDPTNTRTLDISGNGNHAVFTNAPTKNADDRGYSFNGSGNYLTVANSSSLNVTDGITLSFWVKPDTLAGNEPLLFKSINEYYIWIGIGNVIQWKTVGLSDTTLQVSTSNLSLYKWNHLVFTYNGSTKRILINGNEIASEAATGNITGGSNDIIIGRFSGDYYDGLASNVKIWNEGLTPLQIKDLYQRELKQINDI